MHYAIASLGFATGLRPSSFRALRRRGPDADLDLDAGTLIVRRSHTRGDAVMGDTKTGKHQSIALPPVLVAVIREHIQLLEKPPKRGTPERARIRWSPSMAASDLLFPSRAGKFQSRSALQKPFTSVAEKIGMRFSLTPRAMRRTYQDLARTAGIHDVVARSISGHATESMQGHYSTAHASEQRQALTDIASTFLPKPQVKGQVKGKGRKAKTG